MYRPLLLIFLIGACCFFTACGGVGEIPENVVLVDKAATGKNNGRSWADAFVDLQDALAAATSGETIWVAAGTYYASSTNDRTESFQLVDGVEIYGGFDGTEVAQHMRRVSRHVTILSGDIGTASVNIDNTYHVVTGADNAVLDGFTIRDGYATDDAVDKDGAGIFNDTVAPTIRHCIIIANQAKGGGGIYTKAANPRISHCTIDNNSAEYAGGIYNYQSASPIITDCIISNNTATVSDAGGIYNKISSSPELINCTISDNTASDFAGGVYCESSSSPTLTNCIISGNTADYGGGLYLEDSSSPTLSNCAITDNVSTNTGGGLRCWNLSSPTLTNCTISGNDAASGGGLHCDNSSPTLHNSIVWGNKKGGTTSASLTDDYILANGSTDTVTYSLFIASHGANSVVVAAATQVFTDAAHGDYTLVHNSPAIDLGDNGVSEIVDLAGNPRKVNGPDLNDDILTAIVDIGAYENQAVGASTLLAPISNN